MVVYAFFWGIVIKFEANFSKYEKNFGQNFFLLTCRKKPFFKILNFSDSKNIARCWKKCMFGTKYFQKFTNYDKIVDAIHLMSPSKVDF